MTAAALAPAPSTPRVTDDGRITFLAAVTGTPDETDDMIVPGAFARTLRTRRPTDGAPWPRQAGGLLVRGQLNTASREGKAALDDVRFFGPDAAFSIGYKTRRARQRGRLREIHDLDLYECSVGVLHGAHPLARLVTDAEHPAGQLEVKALPTTRRRARLDDRDRLRHERLRRDVARWDRREHRDADQETFAEIVARDHRLEMDAAGFLWRVVPCARCGTTVRFPPRAPVPADARVRCEYCRSRVPVTSEGGTAGPVQRATSRA